MREVIAPLVAALERDRPVACCRVVATRGSTPQGPGATMLLDPEGNQVGTLGGGCVEAEVKAKAAGLIARRGTADAVEILQFTLDHDPAWADGLICGGRMVILAECPAGPDSLAYHRACLDLLEAGAGHVEAIALGPSGLAPGTRFLLDAAGQAVAALPAQANLPAAVGAGLATLKARPAPTEAGGWAFLPTAPTVRLVIVGAGHVGQAVAALATRVGFAVTVIDDRAEYLSVDRFPASTRRVIGPIAPVLAGLTITPQTYALIVTRGHGHDGAALGVLAPSAAGYVGMIGSRRKVREIFETLRDAGLAEADLARVAAPVGLAIGSETVDEIAISITAELIARRNLGAEPLATLRGATGRRAAVGSGGE